MKDYRIQAVYPDGTERTLYMQYPNDVAAVIEFSMFATVKKIQTWLMINDQGDWIAIDGQFIAA